MSPARLIACRVDLSDQFVEGHATILLVDVSGLYSRRPLVGGDCES